jgi:cytochrome P450
VPLSEKCLSEFYQKELEHAHKVTMAPVEYIGFFFKNNEKAQQQRTLFKEIFNFDRLKKSMPNIRKIVRSHVEKLKNQIKAAPDQKLVIDFKTWQIICRGC